MFGMTKRLLAAGMAVGVGLGVAAGASDEARAQWQPRQPVELIIMAGPGGGADQLARLVQSIVQKNNWSPVPLIPINKPGGSGAEALQYLQSKAGDPHVVMVTLNSLFTTPLQNPGLGVDITEFTPIARLARDTFLLWVNANSDIETLDDWVQTAKEDGKNWKMGGTGVGQEDSLVTAMLENEFGVDMTYVPFPGGGTVAQNLVGQQVESTVNNPAEQLGFYEAGRTKPLMQMTPERMEAFPDVPTSAELGHPDLVYYMQRSFVAPPEIPEEAQQWYIDLFRKVHESEEWKKYAESEGLFRDWLEGEELRQYFAEEVEKHKKLIEGLEEG